ncbi:hypothetical protein HPB49_025489 [Dermacentor silvarum]|uniref:Uncharacterized protein n=1 Tax=Dermacentor silvarum TaxID=543639 RepID=A0ACB8D9E0_DERSI|nr:hypothetical protein HPB49_025489 [Dermacentor silvarum]
MPIMYAYEIMYGIGFSAMAITAGAQCCFICVMLILIIATIIPASIFSYTYTQPYIDFPTEPWEYNDWAVVSDSDQCAEVAKQILGRRGSIGDAAVSALACMAVLLPHRCGFGGSLVALHYDSSTRMVTALDGVGVVSTRANYTTFKENSTLAYYGRMAPLVPGAVAGMHAIHKKLGKINWPTLLEPAIALAQQNSPIGPRFAEALRRNEKRIESIHRRLFSKNKKVEYLRMNKGLHQLLFDMADKGWKAFYTGKHAIRLVNDLERDSGFITLEDLNHYEAHWMPAKAYNMKTGKTIHGVPVPGGGALLGPVLDLIDIREAKLRFEGRKTVPHTTAKNLHSFVEYLKFTYARKADLGDSLKSKTSLQHSFALEVQRAFYAGFNPKAALKDLAAYKPTGSIDYDDGGGAYLAVRDSEGNALSIVMSLNSE